MLKVLHCSPCYIKCATLFSDKPVSIVKSGLIVMNFATFHCFNFIAMANRQ